MKVPVMPTLLVLAAAGYMVHLGLWQLDRLHEKQESIASFRAAKAMPLLDAPQGVPTGTQRFRHVRIVCSGFTAPQMAGGRNATGQAGWVQWMRCTTPSGDLGDLVRVGWTERPAPRPVAPAVVTGLFIGGDMGRDGKSIAHIVADPPLAGLAPNATPDPVDLPNNHLSYAVQWFLFAGTALVIYGLALLKRLKAGGTP
jgi:surfeit locus 1 family protein